MLDVIGSLVPYAIGVALSPSPVMAVLMLLSVSTRNAAAMTATRVASVAAIVIIVALLSDFVPESRGGGIAEMVLQLVLGITLMAFGIVSWLRRPRSGTDPATPPRWLTSLQQLSTPGAIRLGIVVTVANLKELAFGVGAGLIIGSAHLGPGPSLVATAVYTALACLSVLVPVVVVAAGGDAARRPLDATRDWLTRNSTVVVGAVMLIIGAMLFGNGLAAV